VVPQRFWYCAQCLDTERGEGLRISDPGLHDVNQRLTDSDWHEQFVEAPSPDWRIRRAAEPV
jgi:hypothetical protein